MCLFSHRLDYVLNVQRTGTHIYKFIADTGVTYGFLHIIVMKDAVLDSLDSIKHKLRTSLEDGYEVPGCAPHWY